MYSSGNWGIEVFLAMSEAQAQKEGCYRCMGDELPNSGELYQKLDEIPPELCITRKLGWQKEICLRKSDFLTLARQWGLLLPTPYSAFLHRVEGDNIWLIGFGG